MRFRNGTDTARPPSIVAIRYIKARSGKGRQQLRAPLAKNSRGTETFQGVGA
jgi:hypothetical protein